MKNFKKVISAVVALALSATTFVSAASFTDVAKTASYAEAIDVLSSLGIVNGYEDGTFKPEGEITRAEAATMIVGALNMTADAVNAAGSTQFADVNEKAAWASGYINVGVAQKFISGMGDGTFAPQANVTYAQMCVMLTIIAGYGDYAAAGGYPTGYTNMAASTGINKGVSVADNTALTRGQVAQMIYNTLTTPMLGVSEYQLTGNSYEQLDGKKDRAFKTLLSDKFNGYTATVVIDSTPVSVGDDTYDNNEVKIDIVRADWWYDAKAPITDATASSVKDDIKMFFAEGVDVNSNLLQQGKAVFTCNDEDEITMVYFASNGKSETKEMDAEEYVKQGDLTKVENRFQEANTATGLAANYKIRFGSKYYSLEKTVDIYVNGKQEASSITAAADTNVISTLNASQTALDNYLGNAIGTIKLVDADDTDGYESIMIDIWNTAKVASVTYENGATVIDMVTKGFLSTGAQYEKIVIDDEAVEEGKTIVTVEKNGEAAELTSIAKGDIIVYKSAIGTYGNTELKNPKDLVINATNDVVTGKLSSYSDEDEAYTIDGTVYSAVVYTNTGITRASTSLAHSYKLTLDPFGRIYEAEMDASATLYAIALAADTGDGEVRLVLADGTVKTYELDSSAEIEGFTASTSDTETIGNIDTYLRTTQGTAASTIPYRVVTYRVKNSTGKLSKIELQSLRDGDFTTLTEFNGRTDRLGSTPIDVDTPVIDTRKVVDASQGSGYLSFSTENFKDGSKYKYVSFGTAKLTSLVVLAEVGTKINVDSRFAVVRKAPVATETEEGDPVESVVVLLDGDAEKELLFETGVFAAHSLAVGDAFFYEVNADGNVSDVFTVLDASSKTFTDLATALGAKSSYISTTHTDDDAWTFSLLNPNKYDIQLVEGYVVSGDNGLVTFAEAKRTAGVLDALTKIDTNIDHTTTGDNGVAVFAATEDTQAYVYDTKMDAIKAYDRFSAKADVAALASGSLAKYLDNDIYGVASAYTTDMSADASYAIAMIVNEEVVEIYAIK